MRAGAITWAIGAAIAVPAAAHAQPYCSAVVDQHGDPVRGAIVTVFQRSGESSWSSGCGAATDAHGRFCLRADEFECAGGHLDVALPDERGGRCTGSVELPDGARPKRITLPIDDRPMATLAGRVEDEHGHPIAGARIGYMSVSPETGLGCGSNHPAITARDGTFSIATRRGDVDVVASADGFASKPGKLATSGHDNRIVLDRGVAWRGRVVAPDGRVLDAARFTLIDLDGVRTVSLARGAFDLPLLAPGVKQVHVEIDDDPVLGTRQEWQQVTVGSDARREADVTFSSGLDLAGTTDPGACVWAYPEAQEHAHPTAGLYVTVKADATGHFAIHHAKPGKWVVRICKDIPMVVVDAGRNDVVIRR